MVHRRMAVGRRTLPGFQRLARWASGLAPPFPADLVPRRRILGLAALGLAVGLAETAGVAVLYLLGLSLTTNGKLPAGAASNLLDWSSALAHLDPLVLLGVGMVAATLVRLAISLEYERRLARLQRQATEGLATQLFQGYFDMSYERFASRNTADRAMQLTTELERAGQAVASWVRTLGMALILVLMAGLLVAVDWRAAAMGALAAAAIGLSVRPLMRWTGRLSAARRPAHADLSVAVAEPLRAYRDLVTSGAWPRFHRAAMVRYRKYLQFQSRLSLIQSAIPQALELGVGLVVCVGIVFAANAAGGPGAATPMLVLLVAGAYRFLPALQRLMQALNLYRTNQSSLRRSLLELEETVKHRDRPRGGPGVPMGDSLLSMQDVRFGYAQGPDVLLGVDLSLRRGQRIGIVGPSGSGKSTIVDLLLSLLRPRAGRLVRGTRPDGSELVLAYLPQQPVFVQGTVLENMALAERDPPDRVEARRLLDLVGLAGVSLDLELGEGGKGLSGGQRQRLGLARSLHPRPDILVLDEPTAALDEASEQDLVRALNTLECAMVIVTHREAPLALCETVLRLEAGRLVELETVQARTPEMEAVLSAPP
ncbi:MAG: ATP-binding cassette, subfamily bacterial [Thermoplasmata archaeon]|nr:ATP-binding cassette, subfamily bacterial [Thermoplasmata archaeon]